MADDIFSGLQDLLPNKITYATPQQIQMMRDYGKVLATPAQHQGPYTWGNAFGDISSRIMGAMMSNRANELSQTGQESAAKSAIDLLMPQSGAPDSGASPQPAPTGGGGAPGAAPSGGDAGGAGTSGAQPGASTAAPPADDTLGFIKKWEGFAPVAEWDYKQYTGGYGTKAEKGQTFTPESAHAALIEAVNPRTQFIKDNVNVPLTREQQTALTSFAFNLGTGKGGLSDLLPDINKGDWDTVAEKMTHYNKAGGEVSPNLVKRRAEEARLVSMPGTPQNLPGAAPTVIPDRTGIAAIMGGVPAQPGFAPSPATAAGAIGVPPPSPAMAGATIAQPSAVGAPGAGVPGGNLPSFMGMPTMAGAPGGVPGVRAPVSAPPSPTAPVGAPGAPQQPPMGNQAPIVANPLQNMNRQQVQAILASPWAPQELKTQLMTRIQQAYQPVEVKGVGGTWRVIPATGQSQFVPEEKWSTVKVGGIEQQVAHVYNPATRTYEAVPMTSRGGAGAPTGGAVGGAGAPADDFPTNGTIGEKQAWLDAQKTKQAESEEYAKTSAKSYATKQETIAKAASDAQDELPQLRKLQQVMKDPAFYSGFAAENVAMMDSALRSAGLSSGDRASLIQYSKKLGSAASLENIREMGQSGAVRVPEMHMIEKSNFDISNTPEANAAVVDIRARLAQRQIDRADFAAAYADAHGGRLDRGFDTALREHFKEQPLFSKAEIEGYNSVLDSGRTKGAAGAPGTAGGIPPAAISDLASNPTPERMATFEQHFGLTPGSAQRLLPQQAAPAMARAQPTAPAPAPTAADLEYQNALREYNDLPFVIRQKTPPPVPPTEPVESDAPLFRRMGLR